MRPVPLAVVLMMLVAPVSSEFLDATPELSTAATVAAVDSSRIVVGHEIGLVVSMSRETGHLAWSRTAHGMVDDLDLHAGVVYAVQRSSGASVLVALDAVDGSMLWERDVPVRATAVRVHESQVVIGRIDGNVMAFDLAGRSVWSATPLDRVEALASGPAGLLVAGQPASVVLDGGTELWRSPVASSAAAWRGPDAVVASGQDIVVLEPDGERARTTLLRTTSALAADFDQVVAGSPVGTLHVLDADLKPGIVIATFADAVTSLRMIDGQAAAAYRSGWAGVLPLDERPVVLTLWPQAYSIMPRTMVPEWAYSDPDAEPGDEVHYKIRVRVDGMDWQDVAAGEVPVERISRIHSTHFDTSHFPSGSWLEIRIEVTDKDGRTGYDRLSRPLRLDHEPPVIQGTPAPGEGEVVISARPTIGMGHLDHVSGIDPDRTQAWVDGRQDGFTMEAGPRATILRPIEPLAEGRHDWRIVVEDRAGNWLARNGSFIVDLRPPEILDLGVAAAATNLLALDWRTDETATCMVTDHDASTPHGMNHSAVLTGLQAGTQYTLHITCTDLGGRSTSTQIVAHTRNPRPGDPQPQLQVTTSPASPDGARNWFVTHPELEAQADLDSDVYWSVDRSPFATIVPTLGPGVHELQAFAVSTAGVASASWQATLKIDPTPPPAENVEWVSSLRLLRWPAFQDDESGIHAYTVETRSGGDWVAAGQLEWPSHRFQPVPLEAHDVRLRSENGAGLTWVSDAISVGQGRDRVLTSAAVVARDIHPGERIQVRFHMAQTDAFETVALRDVHGVERTFADRVRIDTGWEASAPASSFPTGDHNVLLRVRGDGQLRDIAAGTITLHGANNTQDVDSPDLEHVDRVNTPFVAPVLVVAVLLLRRR